MSDDNLMKRADAFRLGSRPTDQQVDQANWLLDRMSSRIEELEAKLAKVKEAFRINMMHALPDYTHRMFDKDYAKIIGETDE